MEMSARKPLLPRRVLDLPIDALRPNPNQPRIEFDEASLRSLSDTDKVTVNRARKIQRFLAQPTFVAEKFTGLPGVYVPLEETLRGFEAILSGEMDGYPEMAFYNVGTLDDALAKAKKMESGEA